MCRRLLHKFWIRPCLQVRRSQFAQGGEGRPALDQCGDILFKFLMIETSKGKDCLSHEATVKRLELTTGDLLRCWMPWTCTLAGRWRSLSRRQLRYHRLICESEISNSKPPVLFGAWRVFLCLRYPYAQCDIPSRADA